LEQSELEILVGELETRLDRLRSLYDQYFMGIEKLEPMVPRKDVERRFNILRKEQIRNTALRFRFQMVLQRYNTYQTYWIRICRQIEEGTYKRDVRRAKARFQSPARDTLRPSDASPELSGDTQPPGSVPPMDFEVDFESDDPIPVLTPMVPAISVVPSSRVSILRDEVPSWVPPSRRAPPIIATKPGGGPIVSLPAPKVEERDTLRAPRQTAASVPPEQDWLTAQFGRATVTAGPPPPSAPASREAPGRPPAAPSSHEAPRPALEAKTDPKPPRPAEMPIAPRPPLTPARPANRPKPPLADPSLSDDRIRQLYAHYIDAKRARSESTAGITFDGLARTLRDSASKLRERHGTGKQIDFEVSVKEGKTILKPVVK
jgi:hypothetical protein